MPDVDDCGGVLGLFRLLHLPQLLPGASSQRLHQAQDATAPPRISRERETGAYFSHPTETKEWCVGEPRTRKSLPSPACGAAVRRASTRFWFHFLSRIPISPDPPPLYLHSPAGRRRSRESARETIRPTREDLKEGQMELRDSVGFPYLNTALVRRGGGGRARWRRNWRRRGRERRGEEPSRGWANEGEGVRVWAFRCEGSSDGPAAEVLGRGPI
jgi:hypothetical protein